MKNLVSVFLLVGAVVASARTTFGGGTSSRPSSFSSTPRVSSTPRISGFSSTPKSSPPSRSLFSSPAQKVNAPTTSGIRVNAPQAPIQTAQPIRTQSPQQVATPIRTQTPVQTGATPIRSTVAPQTRTVYTQPLTRAPSWYTPDYKYRFRDRRYNSGYRYVPVYCDRYGSDFLTGALAGAIVTHMILDNGNRVNVYANGNGGAYVVQNGMNVPLVQDENGNWVQLIQENPQPVQAAYNPQPQRVVPIQPAPVVTVRKPWGPWQWTFFVLFWVLLGFVGWRVYNYYKLQS